MEGEGDGEEAEVLGGPGEVGEEACGACDGMWMDEAEMGMKRIGRDMFRPSSHPLLNPSVHSMHAHTSLQTHARTSVPRRQPVRVAEALQQADTPITHSLSLRRLGHPGGVTECVLCQGEDRRPVPRPWVLTQQHTALCGEVLEGAAAGTRVEVGQEGEV